MKAVVLGVLLSAVVSIEAAAQGISYAWWITATFQRNDEAVEGIPVRELNSGWLRASTITASALPSEATQAGETVEEHGFSFVLDADLDGDGRNERALVGVFQTVSGETGRFLLILGKPSSRGPWVKRALFSEKGAPGFSAVALLDGRLQWVTCLECDIGCEVVRSWWRYRLKCYSCCG